MSNDGGSVDGTVVDPRLAPRRLKVSLVPPETGIFLRVEQGEGTHRHFELSSGGVYIIGRDGSDIPLDDPKVSRKHAEIGLYGPGVYVVRDLASTNGTRVNGRLVAEKTAIKHTDLIQVGDTALRFHVLDATIPLS